MAEAHATTEMMHTAEASNFAPFLRSCKKECSEPVEGKITGEIPRWLRGSLLRNGGGLLEIGTDKFNHAFDSMALMHRFRVRDGHVTYMNRFLHSNAYKRNMSANRIVVTEFGTRGFPDPCKTIFQRFMSKFIIEDFTDNDLLNIIQLGDQFYVCSETNFIHRVDPEKLETMDRVDLSKYLAINTATAHPHFDRDGTYYNMGSGFSLCGPTYNIVKTSPASDVNVNPFETASIVCSIPARYRFKPSYYHSFGMTENYLVFVEQPFFVSIRHLLWLHIKGDAYIDALEWNPKLKVYFHIINKQTGERLPVIYTTSPFLVFHHINAYEDSGHLVVDMCCYNDGEVVKGLCVAELGKIKEDPYHLAELTRCQVRRYVLPMDVSSQDLDRSQNLVKLPGSEATAHFEQDGSVFCQYEALTEAGPGHAEMPGINYAKYNGRKYRFFYALGRKVPNLETYMMKINTETKEIEIWSEEKRIPSEPVFVANPNAVEEDDGILLSSLLHEESEKKVALLILDAKTMKELGRAEFETESSVPGCLHGVFTHLL
ncbi:beta,beta-carotene 15,15'-dioxygenase-like isoform X1 [Limulus polyphemus]|uniref:Beta,beta-carotene 15,15'-dioxygenase-like isoform X1 n=1 Tax=Limulus polyphemus TaxID=6850 RepID=A0ABM1BF18_LIMPO|nr:beta,beta-carotene 15,15'-dioxygenase-like isoform X1 [Limulus polyphemus]